MSSVFIAWRSGEDLGSWGPVGHLEHTGDLFRFYYTAGAKSLSGFRAFPGMSNLEGIFESETLFPLFANRLLSPSRPEYEAFLRWGGFDPNNPPDPIALLGVTEGIRQTDSVEVFPCPSVDGEGCFLSKFFLHGVRWVPAAAVDRIARLQHGERLFLMPDPANPADPNAVAVRTGDERTLIGYVPRYLANDANFLLRNCHPDSMTLTVDRVNPDAPLQNRLLCRMRACWPKEFRPCSGNEFQPLTAIARTQTVQS